MTTVTDKQAQATLPQLLEQTALSHEPIQVTGQTVNGVLISEDDWRSMEETLYLLCVPGTRETIREGMQTPVGQCSPELPW